jgi:predicted transporter
MGALLIFAGVWGLNEWAARKIDRRIQKLTRMELDEQ